MAITLAGYIVYIALGNIKHVVFGSLYVRMPIGECRKVTSQTDNTEMKKNQRDEK